MKEKKRVFPCELAYVFGLLALGFGTALSVAADFGVSMVVAPAYLLHLKISQYLPFFTFGMAEYTLQAVLVLVVAILMRRFKISYLFSFVTAVLYGLALDGSSLLLGVLIPEEIMSMIVLRVAFYIFGMAFATLGVSFFFHTYISPEAYELFVKELSARYGKDIHKFKIAYDACSCLISIVLSFIFFGLFKFEGVKVGTIISAVFNGIMITGFSKLLDKLFIFEDKLPLRKLFDQ